VLVLIAAGVCLSAQSSEGDLRPVFEKLYSRLDAAVAAKDEAEVASLIAEDAQAKTGPLGIPLRGAMLRLMQTAGSSRRSDVKAVTLDGDSAVVTVDIHVTSGGKDQGVLPFREVWIRRGTAWICTEVARRAGGSTIAPTGAEETKTVVAELKARAATLTTVEPGAELDDLEAFGAAVGDARIVALGEGTHGTREFSQLKLRLIDYLVRRKGFTVVAVEGNWPDVGTRLREGATWTGFDMQAVGRAADMVEAFLRRTAPELAKVAAESYAAARRFDEDHSNVFLPGAAEAARRAESVLAKVDQLRAPAAEWRDARHAAATVVAACAMRVEANGFGYRDRMMARNVEWLADEVHGGQKIVLSAHNEHVSAANSGDLAMGGWLRRRFGKQYYSVGTFFRRGEVWATGLEDGRSRGAGAWSVAPSPEGTGDAVLNGAGSLYFLDVRSVPRGGALGAWLAAPHRFNRAGGVIMLGGPGASMVPEVVTESYDGVVFVEESHARLPAQQQ
jgi:erythromycin esterase